MKKYLAFSDSHGDNSRMLEIIKNEKDVDGIFHMGDIQGGEELLRKSISGGVHIVRGNCDRGYPPLPEMLQFEVEGFRVLLTHGHRMLVDVDLSYLKSLARTNNIHLLMYGHTHRPLFDDKDGFIIMNPGSISRPRQADRKKTYAVIIFDDNGIDVKIKSVG